MLDSPATRSDLLSGDHVMKGIATAIPLDRFGQPGRVVGVACHCDGMAYDEDLADRIRVAIGKRR